jgi:hypothetical protein
VEDFQKPRDIKGTYQHIYTHPFDTKDGFSLYKKAEV